jgi:hypothetical protein
MMKVTVSPGRKLSNVKINKVPGGPSSGVTAKFAGSPGPGGTRDGSGLGRFVTARVGGMNGRYSVWPEKIVVLVKQFAD